MPSPALKERFLHSKDKQPQRAPSPEASLPSQAQYAQMTAALLPPPTPFLLSPAQYAEAISRRDASASTPEVGMAQIARQFEATRPAPRVKVPSTDVLAPTCSDPDIERVSVFAGEVFRLHDSLSDDDKRRFRTSIFARGGRTKTVLSDFYDDNISILLICERLPPLEEVQANEKCITVRSTTFSFSARAHRASRSPHTYDAACSATDRSRRAASALKSSDSRFPGSLLLARRVSGWSSRRRC